jgi:hypothetical protein
MFSAKKMLDVCPNIIIVWSGINMVLTGANKNIKASTISDQVEK